VVTSAQRPARGEIWWVELDPTVGSEQAGRRPLLVLSADRFQAIQDRLLIGIPLTRTMRSYPFHIVATAEQTGLPSDSTIMCEQLRVVSMERMRGTRPIGHVSPDVLTVVEDRVRVLLDLP
jgi:mRNA interferase MazF